MCQNRAKRGRKEGGRKEGRMGAPKLGAPILLLNTLGTPTKPAVQGQSAIGAIWYYELIEAYATQVKISYTGPLSLLEGLRDDWALRELDSFPDMAKPSPRLKEKIQYRTPLNKGYGLQQDLIHVWETEYMFDLSPSCVLKLMLHFHVA